MAGTDGRDYFFHRHALLGQDIGGIAEGRRVVCVAKDQATGDGPGNLSAEIARLAKSELAAAGRE